MSDELPEWAQQKRPEEAVQPPTYRHSGQVRQEFLDHMDARMTSIKAHIDKQLLEMFDATLVPPTPVIDFPEPEPFSADMFFRVVARMGLTPKQRWLLAKIDEKLAGKKATVICHPEQRADLDAVAKARDVELEVVQSAMVADPKTFYVVDPEALEFEPGDYIESQIANSAHRLPQPNTRYGE